MSARGRPKKENARAGQYLLRMNEEEEAMLDYICERTTQTKAEAIREGIRSKYNLVKTIHSGLYEGEEMYIQ